MHATLYSSADSFSCNAHLNANARQHVSHLGEISDNVETATVVLGHHVEEKGIRVIIQRLVIEEQFREQTQILRVCLQARFTRRVNERARERERTLFLRPSISKKETVSDR